MDGMTNLEEHSLVLAAKAQLSRAITAGRPPKLSKRVRDKLAERPELQEEVTKWLRSVLAEYAINEYTVAAKIAEGLEAYKVMTVGEEQMPIKVPDYFTQHKYVETAAKMLNLFPPTRQQLSTDGSGIVVRLTPAFGAMEDVIDGSAEYIEGPEENSQDTGETA